MSASDSAVTEPPYRSFTGFIGTSIFVSRWLQAPLYLGLIVAQAVYVVVFWKELVHLVKDFNHLDEASVMLIVLGLVDVVMIANLLIMVIIGGSAWLAMNSITHRLSEVIDDKVPKLEWIASINYNVLDIARGLRNALLEAQDPAQMEAQIANVLGARKRIKETVEKLEPRLGRRAEERALCLKGI